MDDAQQKFVTHYNYVSCLEMFSRSISIQVATNQTKVAYPAQLLTKKVKLILATRDILNIEQQMSVDDPDFALAFCPWLPAKIYYLLFHSWCLVDYLITTEQNRINSDHHALWSSINEKISSGKIVFSEPLFNSVRTVGSAITHSGKTGDNLRQINEKDELRAIRIPQVFKKIADYKLESTKHRNKIKSFIGLKGSKIKNDCYKSSLSLMDFFYQYRLKTNYRDLSFLGDDLDSSLARSFVLSYLKLGRHHYVSVRDLINEMAERRFSKKIIVN